MIAHRWIPLLALLGSAALPACTRAGDELSVPLETAVELEATWQCEVTRFSFADGEAIEAKAAELRTRFGVTADDHAAFIEMLAADPGLRESVAVAIDRQCAQPDTAAEGVAT
jgi:hypothetical protein